MSDWPEISRSATIAFERDSHERFTIHDPDVRATSKILAAIRRPDMAEVDDPGWTYDANVVRRQGGSFDVAIERTVWGEDASQEILEGQKPYTSFYKADPLVQAYGGFGGTTILAFSFVAPPAGGALYRVRLPHVGVWSEDFVTNGVPFDLLLEVWDDVGGGVNPRRMVAGPQVNSPLNWRRIQGPPPPAYNPLDWWLSPVLPLTPGATYWLGISADGSLGTNYPIVLGDNTSGLWNQGRTRQSFDGGTTWSTPGFSTLDSFWTVYVAGETLSLDYLVL